MLLFIPILLLSLSDPLWAKIIPYGKLEDSTKTFYPKTHLQLIELAAKYSPLLQENHLKLINAKNNFTNSVQSLNPLFSLDASWQKNEDMFSELANISLTSNWKNKYGGILSGSLAQTRDYEGKNKWMPTFRYQQPLLKGFGTTVNTSQIESAKDELDEIQINAEEQLSQLILDIEKKLTQADILKKKIKLTKQMISLNNHQIYLRKKRIEAGEVARSTLNNIQLSGQKLKLQLSDLEKEQIQLEGAINQMVGANVSLNQMQADSLSSAIDDFNPTSELALKKIAKNHAYDLKHFLIQQKGSERELFIEENSAAIDANLYVQTESWNRKTQWGVSVNIPLNETQHKQAITRIKTQKRQQQIRFSHMQNQMDNKISQYVELIKKSKQGLDFSNLSLNEAKKVWEIYQKKYQADLVSALEVEKAFLDWYDSGIINIEKSHSLTLSKIEVLHSVGYLLPILNLQLVPDNEIQL
jgi:outer membrane protein TolC